MTSAQVPAAKDRIALLLSDLNGGGVQKMTLALATGLPTLAAGREAGIAAAPEPVGR
jgi:hypothetical protein